MATYTVPSGDRIWAGRDVVMPDPNDVSLAWPPSPQCVIPDAEGINAPIHPKVLDFGSGGWNGHRYWMAYTPYPVTGDPSPDAYEQPCVVVSDDGTTWTDTSTKPVVPAPVGAGATKYNSDTHLTFVDGVLYLFWRPFDSSIPAESGIEKVKYKTTTDGETWSDEVTLFSSTVAASVLLSPCVEFHGGMWHMWVFNRVPDPNICVLRKATTLAGIQTATPITCALTLPDAGREIWHMDIIRVPNGWAMLLSDKPLYGLWLAFSADGENWTVGDAPLTLERPYAYRSSLVRNADKTGFACWITNWETRKIQRLSLGIGV